ncbi:unnamed protein product, partial [Vitis vinifera]|uniref:Ubiquitin-like protease family profile domain-containing protein n=1 Tax=Vitis vinifera TaxID=29760 RepID=D7SZP7_VITVI
MILCGSHHPFFDRKTSIVSKYISELDDCEKCQNMVEFCQTFFKLYDIAKDVFQFSIDWAPSIPTQDNGWDCGVHVIKHMQTFKNGDSMTVFNLCNSVKLRREIASDLVLHKGNREKQTIVAIVCTKTSTRAMKKLLL